MLASPKGQSLSSRLIGQTTHPTCLTGDYLTPCPPGWHVLLLVALVMPEYVSEKRLEGDWWFIACPEVQIIFQ